SRSTDNADDNMGAGGLLSIQSNSARLERIAIDSTYGTGILAKGTRFSGTCRVTIADLVIDGFTLDAIDLESGTIASAARTAIMNGTDGMRSTGVRLRGMASLAANDLAIRDVANTGVAVIDGIATIDRFAIEHAGQVGVDIESGAGARLSHG